MQVTKENIGEEFYPVDNSYSQDLSTGGSVTVNNGGGLAGWFGHPPVKVRIATEPFLISIFSDILGRQAVYQMVIVEYQDKKIPFIEQFRQNSAFG